MSAEAPLIIEALRPVAQALDELGVAYYIGGSIASSFHGRPRSTVDIDLVADLRIDHIDRFVAMLENDYYIDAGMIADAVRTRRSFIHLSLMYKVDVFIPGTRGLDDAAKQRVVKARLPGDDDRLYPLASPEDVILKKLEWYRNGGGTSERQWLDVIEVMRMQDEQLDGEYLAKWAPELNVADLLHRAFRDAVIED